MAQRLKENPVGRRPGYHWTPEQKEAIRQRAIAQQAERKARRAQKCQ